MEPKDSPYYYGNFECPPTQLILKHHGAPVITQELPWDVGLDELFEAFITACIGVGFPDKRCILEHVRDYANEYLPEDKSESEES